MTVDATMIGLPQPKQEASFQMGEEDKQDSFDDSLGNEEDFSKSDMKESLSREGPLQQRAPDQQESFEGIEHNSDMDDE